MNKRRSFLRQAGLLSAGVFLTPAIISCNSNTEVAEDASANAAADSTDVASTTASDAVIGLQLYSLREQIKAEGIKAVIPKVAAAGYKEVETYGYSKENGYWGLDANAFSELLKANNLTSPSGHYGLDPYLDGGDEELLQSYIDAAKVVGQTYITIPYLGDSLRQDAEGYRKLAKRINEAAKTVSDAGLKLAYHNHNFEFENKQPDGTPLYDILLNETDANLVKFELDLYWIVVGGESPIDYLSRDPARWPLYHVKDKTWKDRPGKEDWEDVGPGSIDFPDIFAAGQGRRVDKHFIIEHDEPPLSHPNDPQAEYKTAQTGLDYLRNVRW